MTTTPRAAPPLLKPAAGSTPGSARTQATTPATAPPSTPNEDCILVLQGGGALGAYQAGVFEALATGYHQPSWVAGISIGAITAALVAHTLLDPRWVHRLPSATGVRVFDLAVDGPSTVLESAPKKPRPQPSTHQDAP